MSGPDCLPQKVAIFLTSVALLISLCLNITLYLLRRRERYNTANSNLFAFGEEPFDPDSIIDPDSSDRFEADEMDKQENPIYGNIRLDGGGSFGTPEDEPLCYEQMSQANTSNKNLKAQQEDVSYASLDLATNKKRRKKRKYKQNHQAQTHSQPVSQQTCRDQDPEDDVTLPSRTSSLVVSCQSIYLNSHQVAMEAEERERERERAKTGAREFEMRKNLNEGFDHSLCRSRQSLEEER